MAAAIATQDSLGTTKQAAAATLTPALTLNGGSVTAPAVTLRGPADVTGIDANQVVRTDPRPGTTDFEPNCFPSIEFDRPDFPWLFTPASPNADKIRPWLCLVVVRKQPGVVLTASTDKPAATLQVGAPAMPAVELPDLKDSWAWAHAQVAVDDNSTPQLINSGLNGTPDISLSRLICPRALAPDTDYIACVVPAFEVGRKTGLGLAVTDIDLPAAKTGLQPAWTIPATGPMADVLLPVYYYWEFRTGPLGDFESLALRLKTDLPLGILGTKVVDISQPGFSTGLAAGTTIGMQGALQPLLPGNANATPPPWSDGPAPSFRQNLAPIISEPVKTQALTAPPVLAPPMYGRWHGAKTRTDPAVATWFEELNLDPRWRATAALGTRVVQEHQEALMASAWDQAAELAKANQRLRQLQLSMAVGEVLHKKHFTPLSDERLLRVAAPAFGRIMQAPGASLLQQQSFSQLPVGSNRTAMRRVGRQRGPLTRRVTRQGGNRATSWVALLYSMNPFPPAPPVPAFDFCQLDTFPFTAVTANSLFGAYQVWPEGAPVPSLGAPLAQPAATDVPGFLRKAAADHLDGFFASHPAPRRPLFMVLQNIQPEVLPKLHPHVALRALAKATITTGSTALAPTASAAMAPLGVETVMAGPSFPQPMYEPLRDLSQDLLLPGLDAVAPDTVVGLKTNRRFVEAYMVGLNHEMGRELLWRGYPTDQRATYFSHFWGLGQPNSKGPDITDLNTWKLRHLGDTAGAPAGEQFVMLMRSSLLRRYPNAVIYLAPVLQTTLPSGNVVLGPDPNPANEVMPLFRGSLQPDISFFGFPVTSQAAVGNSPTTGYYVVIQQHPTEPRFGVDTLAPFNGKSHLAITPSAPGGVTLPPGTTWGKTSADMAGITLRQPVRIAIHASRLVTPSK
ncbi:MAG TPA: hypothetical protein VMB21_18400 [Candidatus Limnocylindria bacterium]|nr:hypothetical protein [Candidatus Limnocylindria bacterium]